MSSLNSRNGDYRESSQQARVSAPKSTIPAVTSGYGATGTKTSTATDRNGSSTPDASADVLTQPTTRKRAWSIHEATSLLGDQAGGHGGGLTPSSSIGKSRQSVAAKDAAASSRITSVIYILSKLVILSSLVHQLGFTLFSSLPFAIGTVQDAGLIFLSSMSNQLATKILESDDGTEEQVLSTTLALLSVGTASLGLVLVVMGHFRLAE
jgi:hypothetical protein